MVRRIIGELIESGELSEKAKNISFNDGILYDYNQDAYVKLVDTMEKDGKACAIRATGTGKMYLAIKWLNDNPDKPFVYVAPTNVILNKFVDNLVEVYFNKEDAKKIKAMALEDEIKYLEQNLGFDLHLYTYAKIHRMSTEDMKKVNASHIVLDEFHRCGADKWGKSVNEFLRINSNAKVMGLSATPIRPSDGKNMVEEMFDGKMASELTLVDALEQKILPLPVMINAIYSFEDEIVSLQSQLANKKYDPEKKKEIDKTLKQVKQLIGQSGGVKAIFEDFVEELTRNKGKQDIKMVVFCKDIADRDRKMDECRNWFPKGTKIKKYSVTSKESEKLIEVEDDLEESSKSKKLRQKVIKTFEEDNSKGVKLLFAVDMLNEGLHVKNLDGVIMLRDTSSNIVFLQQLGRALAVDKDRTTPPLVFDLVNNIEVLGEDIEEYKEIIHRLTKNGKLPERLRHHIDFEIQRQIIDLIQYLKDISYTFEDRIAPLLAYYKEFGTIADIITGGENQTKYEFNGQVYNLGSLIRTLRNEYSNKKLNDKEIAILEKMGMIWDAHDEKYRKKLEVLTAYKNDYSESGGKGTIGNIKHSDIYNYQGHNYPIGDWINSFRQGHGLGSEKEIRIQELNGLGMKWNASLEIPWEKKKEVLTAYKDDYSEKGGKGTIGNIKWGEEYIYQGQKYPIGNWISKFRQGGALTDGEENERRVQELNDLGMKWDAERAIPWEKKIEVLTAYKNDYSESGGKGTIGNIKVDVTKYVYQGIEYPIGIWINSFRSRNNLLNQTQIGELESLGIVWDKQVLYDKKIEVLTAYKNDYSEKGGKGTIGNIRQSEEYIYQGHNYSIGVWINSFRQGRGLGSEKEIRIQELNNLGMKWDASRETEWEKKKEVLTAYKDDYSKKGGKGTIGNIKSGEEYIYQGQKYPIGNWIYWFRQGGALTDGEENERRVQELNALGMKWDAKRAIPWEKKIEVLTAYKNDYSESGGKGTIGNIKRSDIYNYQDIEYPIGTWTAMFRIGKQLLNGEEKEKRIQELNDMGMVWGKQERTKKSEPTPSGENFGQ